MPETTEKEETFRKSEYVYEDKYVKVTARLSDVQAIPDDAKLVVTPITEKTKGYDYDTYMDALNHSTKDKSAQYTDDNTLLYDVAFIGTEKDASGNVKQVELQPDNGIVDVNISFKREQLSDKLGAKKPADVEVKHLPLKTAVREKYDTTKEAEKLNVKDVVVEEVIGEKTKLAGKDEVSFIAKDFSVFTVNLKKGRSSASLKAAASNQYTVTINTYDMTGTPAPIESSVTDQKVFFIQANLVKDGKIVGAKIVKFTFSNGVTQDVSFTLDDFKNLSNESVAYTPEEQKISVRLYTCPSWGEPSNYSETQNEWRNITDKISGYYFRPNPEVLEEENKTILHLRKEYQKEYDVEVEFEKGTQVNANEYYYLFVKSEHASTGTTYLLKKLENDGSKTSIKYENVGPGLNWDSIEGNGVKKDEEFTGNENISIYILKSNENFSIDDAKNRTNCDVVVWKYTRNEDNDDVNQLSHTTDTIKFKKAERSEEYTYKDILGGAVNYGIVADTYNQTDHAQTNFATNNYYSNNNFQPDLSNNPGNVLIGNLNSTLHLGDNHRHDFGSVEIQVGNLNGNTFKDDSPAPGANLVEKSLNEITDKVNAMLDYGKAKSNELAAKEPNIYVAKPDSNGNVVIDSTSLGDNDTLYIDGDSILSAIRKTSGLTINKKPNQTLVFNILTSDSVTLGKFWATGMDNEGSHSPVEPHGDPQNEALSEIAKHIVWNIPNSKDVTLNTTTGIFLIPEKGSDVKIDGTSSGWVVTGGTFTHKSGEFHNVNQEMPENPTSNFLSIEKVVEGEPEDSKVEGSLEFEITTEVGGVTKWLTRKGTLSDEKVTLSLKDGFTKDEESRTYKKTFSNLPVVTYLVKETNSKIEGYNLVTGSSVTTGTKDVPADGVATVNLKDSYKAETVPVETETGNLRITKTIAGDKVTEDDLKNLTFTISGPVGFQEQTVTLGTDFTKQTDGTYVYELTGIPTGEYTVNETQSNIEGYSVKTTFNVEEGKAEVKKSETASVEITDEYTKLAETGDLRITKTIAGDKVTEDDLKNLTFTISGPVGFQEQTVTLGKDFTKQTDGTYVYELKEIPTGEYTVSETQPNIEGYSFKSSISTTSGKATITDGKTETIELKDVYAKTYPFKIRNVLQKDSSVLPGAKLKLEKYNETTKKWEEVENWTSDKSDHDVQLEKGKYRLSTASAPDGYKAVNTSYTEFSVTENGKMLDAAGQEVKDGLLIVEDTQETVTSPTTESDDEDTDDEDDDEDDDDDDDSSSTTRKKSSSSSSSGGGSTTRRTVARTGDTNPITMWISISTVSMMLTLTLIYLIRRKKEEK